MNLVKDLHEYGPEERDLQMNVNLKAIFLSFEKTCNHIRKHASDHIVNMGSVSRFVGQTKTRGYTTSKRAVIML